jgi:hypothetical protein
MPGARTARLPPGDLLVPPQLRELRPRQLRLLPLAGQRAPQCHPGASALPMVNNVIEMVNLGDPSASLSAQSRDRRRAGHWICHFDHVITRKNALWWLIGAVVFVIRAPALYSFVIGAPALLGYLISFQLHPQRSCRACGGNGRHFGAVWEYGRRQCMSCAGQGRHRRWGTQFFHADRQVRAEARATVSLQRRGRPL